MKNQFANGLYFSKNPLRFLSGKGGLLYLLFSVGVQSTGIILLLPKHTYSQPFPTPFKREIIISAC